MTDAEENIFFIDNKYTIQKVSRKLSQKIGINKNENPIGIACHDYFFQSDKPCGNCPVSRSIKFQTVVEEDILLDMNDSTRGTRHAVATPVMDNDNQVKQIIVDCLGDAIAFKRAFTEQTEEMTTEKKPLPQLPLEEGETGFLQTIGVVLFDGELNVILSNQFSDVPGFAGVENVVGRNLFSVAPFYNQTPVRNKIETFIRQETVGTTHFRTKSDIYSDRWLEHHLYKLVAKSKVDAYLIISKISPEGVHTDSRALMAEKVTMLRDLITA